MSLRDLRSDVLVREPWHNQERALADFAERIGKRRKGRIAVQIHLSRLQSHNRRDHHVRVALGTFDELVKQFEGELFHLMNHDIVFACKDARIDDIEQAVIRLRYLFGEDPLTRYGDDHTGGGFCTWFVMEQDYDRFLDMARRMRDLAEAHKRDSQRARRAAEVPQIDKTPLTPALLARVEERLMQADLSAMLRNQPICAMTRDHRPEPVLTELYVSIDDLEAALAPEVALRSDPWLFRRLTLTLDRRVLNEVVHRSDTSQRALSLNLNIATLLSAEFQRFDQALGFGVRDRLVIELQKVDIFEDMGAYIFAREYMRERGYKVCLDGLTHLTLPYIDRERLGLDLLKVYWSADLVSGMRPDMLTDLERHVRACGRARVIFCRCDNEDAIRLGHDLGVSLFQGRYVDRLLADTRVGF